jgi:pimeloyl-ACP methyl ester carboxylesterase
MGTVTYRKVDVGGIGVFYREAGPKDPPTILLLHVFPLAATCSAISSRNSRNGFVSSPPTCGGLDSRTCQRAAPSPTFENLASVIDRFTEAISLHRFAIYVFDYGAPVGFRLAFRRPDRIAATPRTATPMRKG